MNHPEINTETIKQRIRQEAMRRKAVPSEKKIEQGIEIFSSPESFIAPKIKETRYEFVNLSDLLPYGDEDFIRNAYRAILKREPDTDGFNDYLQGSEVDNSIKLRYWVVSAGQKKDGKRMLE
jgi:hypothetical protein